MLEPNSLFKKSQKIKKASNHQNFNFRRSILILGCITKNLSEQKFILRLITRSALLIYSGGQVVVRKCRNTCEYTDQDLRNDIDALPHCANGCTCLYCEMLLVVLDVHYFSEMLRYPSEFPPNCLEIFSEH